MRKILNQTILVLIDANDPTDIAVTLLGPEEKPMGNVIGSDQQVVINYDGCLLRLDRNALLKAISE